MCPNLYLNRSISSETILKLGFKCKIPNLSFKLQKIGSLQFTKQWNFRQTINFKKTSIVYIYLAIQFIRRSFYYRVQPTERQNLNCKTGFVNG